MDRARIAVAELEGRADNDISIATEQSDRWSPVLQALAYGSLLLAAAVLALLSLRRRRAEQASTNLLNQVLESAPIGIGLLDSDGVLLKTNPSLASVGQGSDGVARRSLWEMFPAAKEELTAALQPVTLTHQASTNVQVTLPKDLPGWVLPSSRVQFSRRRGCRCRRRRHLRRKAG